MRISAIVAGTDTYSVATDLASYLASELEWATVGDTVIPLEAVPLDMPSIQGLENRIGATIISVDVNQPMPEYADGGAEPDKSDVRLLLEQLVSSDADDTPMLIARRRSLIRVLSRLSGPVG